MYDAELTARRLHACSQRLGFKLQRFAPGEAQSRAADLAKIAQPTRNGIQLKRPLKDWEQKYIVNEQTISRHDFPYWSQNYAKIIDDEAKLVSYKPQVAQQFLNEIRAEHERAGIAMEFLNLKARQLGVSTDSELVVAHRCQFGTNIRAVVGSSDPANTEMMAEMMRVAWEHQPWFLMPRMTAYRVGELFQFGDSRVTITLQWLNQTKGIGRGRTPHVVHISELSDAEHPEKTVEASLWRAMHPSPSLYAMYESTANGEGNWFHERWKNTKTLWAERTSRLRPCFLPWFVGSDRYPKANWLKAHPIPEPWQPAELTKRHARRAEAYVERNDLLRKLLGANWKLPRHQQWWWECEYNEHKLNKTLNVFFQELPADDIEAFQSSLTSIFDAEVIATYRQNVQEPIVVYGLRGRNGEVPERHQPAAWDVNPDQKPHDIKAPNGSRFQLVPLIYRGIDQTNPMGKIFVYEQPEHEQNYGFGVDTSFGIGENRCAVEMMRKAGLSRAPRIVAELVSDRLSASDLIPFAYAMGCYYTVVNDGQMRQPKAVVERNQTGEIVQLALLKMGWSSFHVHETFSKYAGKLSKSPSLGVINSSWFRDQSMDRLISALRDMFLDIDSPWFIEEMASLEMKPNGKIEHKERAFDDRILAAAIVYLSLHVRDPQPLANSFGFRRISPVMNDEQRYAEFQPGNFLQALPARVLGETDPEERASVLNNSSYVRQRIQDFKG